jgi:hypothetical protein
MRTIEEIKMDSRNNWTEKNIIKLLDEAYQLGLSKACGEDVQKLTEIGRLAVEYHKADDNFITMRHTYGSGHKLTNDARNYRFPISIKLRTALSKAVEEEGKCRMHCAELLKQFDDLRQLDKSIIVKNDDEITQLKADNEKLKKTISDIERFAKAGYCMTISKSFVSDKIKVTKLQYNNFKDRTTIQPTLQEAVAAFMAKCDFLPTPPTTD